MYKLKMFWNPVEVPTDIFCDNEAVYKKSSTPDSTLRTENNSITYQYCREAVA